MLDQKQITAVSGEVLDSLAVESFLREVFTGVFDNQKVLLIVPDQTRSFPLSELFPVLQDVLLGSFRMDVLIALGTHPPLSDEEINHLLGLSPADRVDLGSRTEVFNHNYLDDEHLIQVGEIAPGEVQEIAGNHWHSSLAQSVPVRLNSLIFNYDQILILGPVFPHEVVGFSGGAKYLFPGISGPKMIDATHWLGALVGVQQTIGEIDTPVRRMIHAAAKLLPIPVNLLAAVVDQDHLVGLFSGDIHSAWERAVDTSSRRHIIISDQRYSSVLSQAPLMYDELWTAAKAMYKTEALVKDGGELILYAPHLRKISAAHGKYINTIGYHVMPYYLERWDDFQDIPLAVLAHSTHLKGEGVYQDGKELSRIEVVLATRIPEEVCRSLNLGYRDPDKISVADWMNREEMGRCFIQEAGESLYRLD